MVSDKNDMIRLNSGQFLPEVKMSNLKIALSTKALTQGIKCILAAPTLCVVGDIDMICFVFLFTVYY